MVIREMDKLSRRRFLIGSSGAIAGTLLTSQLAADEADKPKLTDIEAAAELMRKFGCVNLKTVNGRVMQLEIDRHFGCAPVSEKTDTSFNDLLRALTHLESLDLEGSRTATSDTLKAVGSLRRLSSLNLSYAGHIRDNDLQHLKLLKHLQSLVLGNSHVTGSGLAHLKETSLVALTFGGPISDEGLKAVGALKTLKQLYVAPNGSSKATAAGVAELGNLTSLKALSFDDTYRQLQQPSDAFVIHLAKCRKLSVLHLKNTALTDAAVPDLLKMKHLRDLHIPHALTRKATRRLIDGLPNTTIHSRWTKHGRLLTDRELSGRE